MKFTLPLWRMGLLQLRPLSLRRHVSTLSPMASAFNTRPSKKLGFSLTRSNVGLFSIPELTDASGFEELQKNVKNQVDSLIQEACSSNRTRKMVVIFDELSDCICRVADMADFVRVSHPDVYYKYAAEQTCHQMIELVEKLNTNVAIHEALKTVIEKGDVVETTEVDRRVAELFMFDFEQSGIHLEADKRERFVKLNEAIMKISNGFMEGTHRPTPVMSYADMEPELNNVFHHEAGKSFLSSLQSDHYAESVREAAYKIFLRQNPAQEDMLTDLLEGRLLLANLVGFPTFAHRTLRGTLGESPEKVTKFLEAISKNMKADAQKDYEVMRKLKLEKDSWLRRHDEIMPWDPSYFTIDAKARMYDEERLIEYFSLGACMEGLNNLFQCLYDVSLHNVKPDLGEVWHFDVYKLAVVHKTEGLLGYIYCDFYERQGKPNQDCHFTIQGGRLKDDGEYQIPIVVLQLNFQLPGSKVPSLLSPGNVENLFHEFGHAMHSMLGRTRYQHVTGTRTSIDFAEVPSVLMEYFASDPRVIRSFAKHYQTGEPLDTQTLQNFCNSKRIFINSEMQLQVFYAILDQVYHGPDFSAQTTTEVLAEVQAQHYGLPYVENTAWQLRFGHLVGYGGKYYSYLMSRAIASRIWRQCFQQDPFCRENGENYKQKLLAHGGERHPSELVEDLLGEKPTLEFLVDSLTEDLKSRSVR